MKYKYLILLLCVFLASKLLSQNSIKLRPDKFDTIYRNGFLVTHFIEANSYEVKKIICMDINISHDYVCSTTYRWQSYNDTSEKGTYCNDNSSPWLICIFESDYKGDSVIKYSECEEYYIFKSIYFIPNKKRKHNIGKEYILQSNEYFAELGEWDPKPYVITVY